ncbi:hypothetical protein ES705_24001 [subsurface metagenome]
MDNLARLLAALSELSIDELRLVLRFVEFLTEKQAKERG